MVGLVLMAGVRRGAEVAGERLAVEAVKSQRVVYEVAVLAST